MQEWPEYTQKYIEQCAAQKFTTGMNREIYSTISDKIISSVRRKAVPNHGTELFHGMTCMISVVQCFLDNTYKG